MQKKILSDQSLDELKRTEKKIHSIIKSHIVLLCILIGVAIYLTIKNEISIYTILPLFFVPIFIYTLINLKKVKNEIKVRNTHIFMQNKMQESK